MNSLLHRIRTGLVTITGTGAGASVVLALLVLATVFGSIATPRASLAYRTKALRQVFSSTPPAGRTVFATVDMPSLGAALGPFGQPQSTGMNGLVIAPIGAELARNVTATGVPLQPGARWWGVNTAFMDAPGASKNAYFGQTPPKVELLDRSNLADHSKLVAGRMPVNSSVGGFSARFEVAVTTFTAARFKLKVGSTVTLAENQSGAVGTMTLVVTGILRATDVNSAFWTADPNALRASFNKSSFGGFWLGGMIVGDAEMDNLERALTDSEMLVTWEFPLDLSHVQANDAGRLGDELSNGLTSDGTIKSTASPLALAVQSELAGALTEFVQTEGEVGSLLSLLYVSLAIVGLVVLLLGARLLAERRAVEFSLFRARGAARRQLVLLSVRAGAVVVIPAALVGTVLAVLVTPDETEPLAWWLGGLTILATLVAVPWLTLRRIAGTIRIDERADSAVPRKARVRRIVIDAAAVAGAVSGLIVLRLQGQPASGTDWYTSAAPVLIAVPMAIVVVRTYPVLLRWLVALAGRRPGVTTFVGLARAARTSMTAVLPAFALVLVLAVIAFGAMLRSAVVRGDVAASYRQTGADVVIDANLSNAPLSPATQRALAAVPGVTATAALAVTSGIAADDAAFGVLVVDPARYAKLLAQTTAQRFPATLLAPPRGGKPPAAIPILISRGVAGDLKTGKTINVGVTNIRVRPVGMITVTPGVPETGPFIVMPSWAASREMGSDTPTQNFMLLNGPVNEKKLNAAVARLLPGETIVTYRSAVLSGLTGAPLPRGAFVTFAEAAIEAAVFGAIIMLIMLALGARPRELTLARLLTMGLSQGQARRLVIAEALPSILAAALGGAICALALVPLLGPSINLSPFTGSPGHVPLQADLPLVGYLAAGLVALALLTLFGQATATRMRGIARALRVGE